MRLHFRKHGIKDLSELEELVAANAEGIEPGFQFVAAGINLGRSTIELLGLDAHNTPALIALGATGGDELLFRMVEAYTWSLEYPEFVQRLLPEGRAQAAWPPRVMFIAERIPEAFLRKLKVINFPAVDCLEFRCLDFDDTTGFYFEALDLGDSVTPGVPSREDAAGGAKGWSGSQPVLTEPPAVDPRTADCVQRPAVGSVPGPGDEPAQPPQQLEFLMMSRAASAPATEPLSAPPPAEAANAAISDALEDVTAPDWMTIIEKLSRAVSIRQDAEPATGAQPEPRVESAPPREAPVRQHGLLPDAMKFPAGTELAPQWRRFFDTFGIDDRKIAAVREYLQREFPLCTIYDFQDHQRNGHAFVLQDRHGNIYRSTTVSAEFFDAHRSAELQGSLENLGLAPAMRRTGQAGLWVTPTGLEPAVL